MAMRFGPDDAALFRAQTGLVKPVAAVAANPAMNARRRM
jgi:hypothetical protein